MHVYTVHDYILKLSYDGYQDMGRYLKGQLLLDGGNLFGSFFHRTVVLICEHNSQGAFGLILNREAGVKVGEALPSADLPDSIKEAPLYIGGPVQPGILSYLVTDDFLPDANVIPEVKLGHSLEELIELARLSPPTRQIKIFAGYSGWSPGQLEREMERKAWLTYPAKKELVFYPRPKELWRYIMMKKGPLYRLVALSPENPAWN